MTFLLVAVVGAMLVLFARDRILKGRSEPVVLMPSERVLVESRAGAGSTLSIPRYKLFQDPGSPERIWAGLSLDGEGGDTFLTVDGGDTWTTVASIGWEMHMSLAGNDSGYVHFIDRGSPTARYLRLDHDTFEPDAATGFTDYGNQTTSGNVAVHGNVVVVFTRNRDDNSAPVHWHRSTDNGSSWQHGVVHGTGNDSDGLHRIGSCVIDGEVALVYWKETGAQEDTITLHRWNGTAFARLDGSYATSTSSPYTRQFAITQDAAGLIHLVAWDIVDGRRVVRHSTRRLDGAWSQARTIVEWENDDIHPQLSAYGDRVLLLYLYNPDSSDASRAQVYYSVWNPETEWQSSGTPLYGGERAGARYPTAPQVTSPHSTFVPVMWSQGEDVHFLRLTID